MQDARREGCLGMWDARCAGWMMLGDAGCSLCQTNDAWGCRMLSAPGTKDGTQGTQGCRTLSVLDG